jgi:hypothetical protein
MALVLASAGSLHFFTSASDLKALGLSAEAKLFRNLGFELFQLFIFEFDDFITVSANEVTVMRVVSIVGIVELVVLAEVHLAN